MAGAWCFKELARQREESIQNSVYETMIHTMCWDIYHHECEIIDMIFSEGFIEGIDHVSMKRFVARRIDVCLENLGMRKLFNMPEQTIDAWFYKGINNYKMNDFFNRQGREYQRGWSEKEFVWE